MIECPRCGSMQIEQTMHKGYNYLECVNCGALMDYDGKLTKEGDSE